MAATRWTLLDESVLGDDRMRIDAADVPGTPTGWSVERRRLTTGLSAGVDVVEVCTPRVRMVLVPTRGMGLWRASIDGVEVGWQSPVRGPVHPALVPVSEPSGLGWLDGFDETMCRCGLESFGAPDFDAHGKLRYPLHGRIANRPAHRVDVEVDPAAGTITVEGVVDSGQIAWQD